MADEDLPVMLPDSMDFQFMEKRTDGALAADHLFPRDQMARIVDVHDRLHTQCRSKPGGRCRNTAAALQEMQIVHGIPVMQFQLVIFQPLGSLDQAFSGVPHFDGFIHQATLTAGSRKRIDNDELTFRKLLSGSHRGIFTADHGSAQAAGKTHIQHIHAFSGRFTEHFQKSIRIHL